MVTRRPIKPLCCFGRVMVALHTYKNVRNHKHYIRYGWYCPFCDNLIVTLTESEKELLRTNIQGLKGGRHDHTERYKN